MKRGNGFIDLTGKKFKKLKVIKFAGTQSRKQNSVWLCKCSCGNKTIVLAYNLKNGNTTSCGCVQSKNRSETGKKWGRINVRSAHSANTKHGLSKTKLFKVWDSMKYRCYTPTCRAYKNYGGRGIKVCNEWKHNFKAFYYWAIHSGYKIGLTIDRIDNDGNYKPSNCRWVDFNVQANNRRKRKINV